MPLRRPKKISNSPGVYIFRKGTTPLYIGKAANLRQRLGSYFAKAEGRTPKIERMLAEATRVETIETASEIEALIKEAELIKKCRPKYNLLMRDDKSYFYVGVTKEPYPRIFISHQPGRQRKAYSGKRIERDGRLSAKRYPLSARYIGPFTSGGTLRVTLKLLRRIFPYCTCMRPHTRPCLNAEIGRCAGYCCSPSQLFAGKKLGGQTIKRTRAQYRKGIQNIVAVLSGERSRLVGRLKREMREAVKRERYEEAARLRDAVFGLEDVFA
ncbi:MAG: GIY-YIG nuclease family protein, partial [bacterium]|nr:GIY-YIG nuclease family protein [bacterium]